MIQQIVAAVILLTLSIACQPSEGDSNSSETSGRIATASRPLRRPPDRSPEILSQVAARLKQVHLTGTVPQATIAKTTGRDLLAKAFLSAVEEVEGVPRAQGEEVLRALVSPESVACGGASCARVFDVKKEEVDDFMNFVLTAAGSSKALARPEAKRSRTIILSSVAPEGAFSAPTQAWDFISHIYENVPRYWPDPQPRPTAIVTRKEAQAANGPAFVEAVFSYTESESDFIRKAEISVANEVAHNKEPDTFIKAMRWKARLINQGLAKLPVVQQVVYRGMKNIPPKEVAFWTQRWLDGKPIYLGQNNMPALTSASWDIETARDFLKPGLSGASQTKFSVLFELYHHKGVGIESMSFFPSEHEVLIPSQRQFKIEDISAIGGEHQTIIIRMRGLDSASAFVAWKGWAARAA